MGNHSPLHPPQSRKMGRRRFFRSIILHITNYSLKMKIWQKNNHNKKNNLTKLVEKFTVGKDYLLDQKLVPYDILASKAHAEGLEKIGILNKDEVNKLKNALDEILKLWEKGKFQITLENEDCHTAIENFLIEKCGDLGKKIHTGRSRNDQILVAVRLFTRENLNTIITQTKSLANSFLDFAKKYEFIPMPGYTHTQRAMLSSLGMWAGSFAEMLILNLETLKAAQKNVNQCPLGSAAGFGVNFDLPREFVAEKLGFDSPIIISVTAQNTRGKIEADVLSALVSLSATLAHFSNDLVLFTSSEFDFFDVDKALTTGSSIMPQKKNLDPAELIRAKYSQTLSYEFCLRDLTKNLISGYHRDLQISKEPLFGGLENTLDMLEMTQALIENIVPKESNLRKKCTPELFAADAANDLVKKGMSFRDAYKKVGNNLDNLKEVNLDKNLRSKKHLGATGNLGLEKLEVKLKNC